MGAGRYGKEKMWKYTLAESAQGPRRYRLGGAVNSSSATVFIRKRAAEIRFGESNKQKATIANARFRDDAA